jgi:hypothetical protein
MALRPTSAALGMKGRQLSRSLSEIEVFYEESITYSHCKVAKLLILHTAKSISDRLLARTSHQAQSFSWHGRPIQPQRGALTSAPIPSPTARYPQDVDMALLPVVFVAGCSPELTAKVIFEMNCRFPG